MVSFITMLGSHYLSKESYVSLMYCMQFVMSYLMMLSEVMLIYMLETDVFVGVDSNHL